MALTQSNRINRQAELQNSVLVNRPIVCTKKGVRLCRPSEAVLDLLNNLPDSFIKEDGEVIVENGQRVG